MDLLAPLLLPLAREAIDRALRGESWQPAPLADDAPRGVFVTLWKGADELRGCIGHIEPVGPSLAGEVGRCAVLAAFEDPRFPPVTAEEMPRVALEISLLTPLEPVLHLDLLDPGTIGVVVSCGRRRGVLLPGVRGVDTVDQQIAIALRKAGIARQEPWLVHGFRVVKLTEQPAESVGSPE